MVIPVPVTAAAAVLCLALITPGYAYDPLSQASHPVEPLSRALHRDRWDATWSCNNDANCNNLGRCDLISGKCLCHTTYYGQRCEYKRCPVSKLNEFECGGHGACMASKHKTNDLPSIHTDAGETARFGTCSCEVGWSGPACDTRTCRDDCAPYGARQGTCQQNVQNFGKNLNFDQDHHSTCECFPGYYGYSCEFKRCPVSPRGFECDTAQSMSTSVHGYCDRRAGKCLCAGDSYGPACEFRKCPGELRSLSSLPGDRTMTHSGVRRLGNGFGITDSGSKVGKEWPVNIFAVDVSKSCTQQGTCNPTMGTCTCFEGFLGADCSLRHCPNSTRGFICDAAGDCDYKAGQCHCITAVTAVGETVSSYGKDCSLRTCPLGSSNQLPCDGEGTCDDKTGLCKCYPGRYGSNCEKKQCPRSRVLNSPDAGFYIECDNHGTCDSGTGRCKCNDGFYGADCSLAVCPHHNGQMCNKEGSCINEGSMSSVGKCKCNEGFYGDACQYRLCPHSGNDQECSGNGQCNKNTGLCRCAASFYGKDCGFKKCPELNGRVCNLNGKCIKEVLSHDGTDFGDFSGHNDVGDGMDLVMGPDGRGSVVFQNERGVPVKQGWSGSAQGRCLCDSGFYGDACQFRLCPRSAERQLQCDGHGLCAKDTGYCKCTYGYFGADCSIGSCPEHHGNPCNNQGECRKVGTIGASLTIMDHVNTIDYKRDVKLDHNPFDTSLTRDYVVADTTDTKTNADLGYCVCKPPFYGLSCEKKRCPVSTLRQLECDGNGDCDTRVGLCKCNQGWYGKDCSYKRCPEHNGRVCNLQGDCVKSDLHRTDTMNAVVQFGAGGEGSTRPGECRCRFPYFGDKCQYKRCPILWPSNAKQGDGPRNMLYAGHGDENSDDHLAGLDFLKPTEACGKMGTCNYNTGKCTCPDGYSGESCEIKECPMYDGRVCNLQGKCHKSHLHEDNMGTCECTFPYYGVACEYKRCPTSKARPATVPWGVAPSHKIGMQVDKSAVALWGYECDGHGTCNQNTGRCVCNQYYSGESCQKKECPLVNGFPCNKHGKCVENDQSDDRLGTCVCQPPYFGHDCSKKRCPSSSSNQAGSWHGMNRAQECDGNGECNYDTGRCNCDDGFSGLDCSVRRNLCPVSNKNADKKYKVCNGEGACNKQTGLCQCYSEEFSGLDCSHRRCPFYPDVNGLECNGHGDCIQGYDERGQWTGICQCESAWSGKMCQENYKSTTVAQSTPPPSFHNLPPHKPDGAFITDPRRHVVLGSEGRDIYEEDTTTQIEGDSYQSTKTSTRSANYYAGQHPVNQACYNAGKSDMKSATGCQHSVTHPEPYTGKEATQPLEMNSYDDVGLNANAKLDLGQEQPTGVKSYNHGY